MAEGVTLFTCNGEKRIRPLETNGMTVKRDGILLPEDFRHEQYLLIEEDGGQVALYFVRRASGLRLEHILLSMVQ